MSEPRDIKAHAHRLINDLPDNASWDDVEYAVHICQLIEAGLADVAAGRTISHEEAIASARATIRRASPPSA
jgi:predicted transcriptional regulator